MRARARISASTLLSSRAAFSERNIWSARTNVGVPLASMRAMPPLAGPPGTTLVTVTPKKMLPAASLVSGVLTYTVALKAAGAAAYTRAP